MAATRPIIHTMGPPVAAMTALNAPCTAVAALVTALHAACAVWASFILPASWPIIWVGPPSSIMVRMPLLTPVAVLVTASMVLVRAVSPLLRA